MKNLLIITQKVDKNDQLLGFFLDWISGFSKHFERVNILCLEKGEFSLPLNVKVRSLGKDGGYSKIVQLLNFYKQIFSLRSEYDAVFVHMNPIWVFLGSWCWHLMGKKVSLWYAHKSITPKLKIAEKLSDIIFTSTPEGFRIPSKKVRVVGQGINVNLFKMDENRKPDPAAIISVGRIAPIKDYETLIEAARILKDQGMNPVISIVGEPGIKLDFEYEEKLKKMVKESGLEKNIAFLGKIRNENLPSYYQKHKLYINLSNTGSLDKTILEAMASGCTVLSSNDSAKTFLPAKLVVKNTQPQELARQIKEAFHWDFGDDLRQYVVNNHSVERLIETISNSMKS